MASSVALAIEAAAQPTITTTRELLQGVDDLLKFETNEEDTPQQQIDAATARLRELSTTQRSLERKLGTLERKHEEWVSAVTRATADDPPAPPAILVAYQAMVANPEGIAQTIEETQTAIEQIAFLIEDMTLIINRLNEPLSSATATPHPQAPPPAAPSRTISPTGDRTNHADNHSVPANPDSNFATRSVPPPKLQLPKFSGEQETWFNFWPLFEKAIDEQPFSDVEKLAYLRSCLVGAALEEIQGYNLVPQNYAVIKDALQRRFGNVRVLRDKLFAQLDGLQWNDRSHGAFRTSLHSVECILRQMKNLGDSVDQPLIRHLIEKKLPHDVKLYIEDKKFSAELWDTEKLMSTLQHLLLVRENAAPNASQPSRQFVKPTSPTRTSAYATVYQQKAVAFSHNQGKKPNAAPTWNHSSQADHNATKQNGLVCAFCGENHWNRSCPRYRTPQERYRRAREARLCFRCLSPQHSSSACTAPSCRYCNHPHHSLLCFRQPKKQDQRSPVKTASSVAPVTKSCNTAVTRIGAQARATPLLLCQRIPLFNVQQPNRTILSMVFLDSGSQATFISEALATKLKLHRHHCKPLQLTGVGAKEATYVSTTVTFGIKFNDGTEHAVQAHVLPRLTDRFLHATISDKEAQFLRQCASNVLTSPLSLSAPDVLIGTDFIYAINPRVDRRLPSGFFLLNSTIGPMIGGSGRLAHQPKQSQLQTTSLIVCPTKVKMEDFWSLEAFGITPANELMEDDDLAIKQFNQTVRQLPSGRYEVAWPWKDQLPSLANNFGLCFGRLQSLLNKLRQNPSLMEQYAATIKQQLEDGIIERAPDTADGPLVSYLPHQCVVSDKKQSTKMRVVYDASASVPPHHSLNDQLLRGPVLIPKLVGVLLRMRRAPIAVVADLEKAYHQLALRQADRDATRFLWMEHPEEPLSAANVIALRFARVPFGVISAPFLLAATIHHHLKRSTHPVAPQILDDIYVDNVLLSASSSTEAVDACKAAKSLFAGACMNLRQFASNCKAVSAQISPIDRHPSSSIKVLGIEWKTEDDILQVGTLPMTEFVPTQRNVLRFVASHFDPLGFYCPVLLPLKIFLQDLTKNSRTDPATDMTGQWQILQAGWQPTEYCVPRCLPEGSLQLHVFTDASERAFAAVVFIRADDGRNVRTTLVFAKSRLAPISGLTIPRMELMGTLLGVMSIDTVAELMHLDLDVPRFLWTDSRCALSWITGSVSQSLPRFVKNRVEQIKTHQGINFRFVPGIDNPADLASRGCLPSELGEKTTWWNGPPWLTDVPNKWPETKHTLLEESPCEEDPEMPVLAVPVVADQVTLDVIIDPNRYSDWTRILRVAAWVTKFVQISKRQRSVAASHSATAGLAAHHVRAAELLLLRQAQRSVRLADKQKWDLRQDEHGIWRCHGRLTESVLPRPEKYPVFLPRDDPISGLIISHHHRSLFHGGASLTLASVRRRYWIPKGRQAVRKVITRCPGCRRWNAKPFALPKMPSLPETRVQPTGVFQNIGVDLFGPIVIAVSEGVHQKRWITLFTCFQTRAVHLEIAHDLSALHFLHCLRRFVARRGQPALLLSDNATNLRLTAATLKAANEFLVTRKTEWQFTTELAPWQGGLYERLIGITKRAMKTAIGNRLLSEADLRTMTTEVEAVINQRPLTSVSADSIDVLRPMDFLQPSARLDFDPGESPEDEDYNPQRISSRQALLSEWRKSAANKQRFWQFWNHEYMHSLRERTQYGHRGPRSQSKRSPHLNEVVLLMDENRPRGTWKLGKIVKLHEESGTRIKAVTVELANGHRLNRPVSLLCPLEVPENESQEQATSPSPKPPIQIASPEPRKPKDPRTQPSHHPMTTRSRSKQIASALTSAVALLCAVALFSKCVGADSTTAQLCPYRHSGIFMELPLKQNCSRSLGNNFAGVRVALYMPTLAFINATYCTKIERTVCASAILIYRRTVEKDETTVQSIPATECAAMLRTKRKNGEPLQRKGNRWMTAVPTKWSYPWIWGTSCYTSTNFVMEEGQIAFSNGTGMLGSTRTAGCHPEANKCYTERETIIWNGTEMKKQCRLKLQGLHQAQMSDQSVIIDSMQTAFVRSHRETPTWLKRCNIRRPILMENNIVVAPVSFDARMPKADEKQKTKKVLLSERMDAETDPENPRLQYLYDKGLARDAQRWCAAKNEFIAILSWVSLIDTTAAVRMMLGRDDVAGHYVGKKILVTQCQQIVTTRIFHDHKVDAKCFEWTPAEVGGKIVFIQPHSKDIVLKSREIACSWKPPGKTQDLNFEDLDQMTGSEAHVTFNRERLPDLSLSMVQLALDRLERSQFVSAPQKMNSSLSEWMSDSEEFLHEIGHGIDVATEEIQAGFDAFTSKWKMITGGVLVVILGIVFTILYLKCGKCGSRGKTNVNIHLGELAARWSRRSEPEIEIGEKACLEKKRARVEGETRFQEERAEGSHRIYSPPKFPPRRK